MFTSIGAPEVLVIFLVILVLFGADKLPEIARGIGKGMNEFKKASDNLKNEFENEKQEIKDTYESSFKDQWVYDAEEDGNTDKKEIKEQNTESKKTSDNQENSN